MQSHVPVALTKPGATHGRVGIKPTVTTAGKVPAASPQAAFTELLHVALRDLGKAHVHGRDGPSKKPTTGKVARQPDKRKPAPAKQLKTGAPPVLLTAAAIAQPSKAPVLSQRSAPAAVKGPRQSTPWAAGSPHVSAATQVAAPKAQGPAAKQAPHKISRHQPLPMPTLSASPPVFSAHVAVERGLQKASLPPSQLRTVQATVQTAIETHGLAAKVLTVQLHPPQLGHLRLIVRGSPNRAFVVVHASSSVVAAALRSHLSPLMQTLRAEVPGLVAVRVAVDEHAEPTLGQNREEERGWSFSPLHQTLGVRQAKQQRAPASGHSAPATS